MFCGCRGHRSVGPIVFAGFIAHDLDLAGEDFGKESDNLVAWDGAIEGHEVAADGLVDIPVHLLSRVLPIGVHERMACCESAYRTWRVSFARICSRMGSR